ncbi:MAG: hypothetical protein ACYDCO_21375 [Armatimonadota bacterium]
MFRNLLLALCYCCLFAAWGASPADTLRQLEQADRALAQAEQHPAGSESLVRQAASLVPADACPAVRESLTKPTKASIARARRQVQALREVNGLTPAAGPSGAAAGSALREVLARGEFSSVTDKEFRMKVPEWLKAIGRGMKNAWLAFVRAWNRFWGWFGRLFGKLFKNWDYKPPNFAKLGPGVRTALIVVGVLAVLLLLGFLVNRLLVYWQVTDRRETRRLSEGDQEVTRDRPYTTPWDQAMAAAEACWARGDQREALRIVLRACLALLDGRGVLRYDESRANGEVLRELRRLGRVELHGPMRTIVRAFDRGWYGFLTLTGDEFTTVLDTSRQLRTTIMEES